MNLDGKTILITGSTDGVGRVVALDLAAAGAAVLVHGRDSGRGESLLAEMRAKGNDKGHFYRADLASLAETRELAEAIIRNHLRLHVLINNAGLGSGPRRNERSTSRDGHELRFAVNYLSGFLLANLLLPLLKAGAPSRIVNVASLGQHPIDFDDVMITKGYSGSRAYACFRHAMGCFERAEAVRPPANDDAILRWNSCARMIMSNPDVVPSRETVEAAANLGE